MERRRRCVAERCVVTAPADSDVTLVTEGTYPFHHGGVTVWTDQLVRGLPDHRFDVVAISGSGSERPVVEIPDNVISVRPVPLWGPTSHRRRRLAPQVAAAIADAHEWLLSGLVDLGDDPEGDLLGALGRLHELSLDADVAAALRGEAAVKRVHACLMSEGLGTRGGEVPRATVGDALAAGDLIEHFLRPLWIAPSRSRVTHCVSNGLPALVGFAAKWTHGTPLIVTEHGVYLRERYLAPDSGAYSYPVRALVLRFFRTLTGAAYRVADLITPGSEYNLRWQVQVGADEELIRPVHNGVDPLQFPSAGREPTVPTLAWVGRVDPLKDLETLIRAFALVRDAMPEARLRMFGPTPEGNESYRDRCVALIAELGLEEAATFEGRIPQITDAYRAGNVIVLTSVSEGFPYTVIEAMASARATVSTDVGGVREAVADAGVVVPPRDVQGVAAACLRLLRNRSLRSKTARNARARVLDRFTLVRFLDVYRGIYADIGIAPASSVAIHPAAEPDVLPNVVGVAV
jgi:glycosyltransferase involved in cell wall biosynthesis